jgi:hypothetical protein
MRPLSFWLLLIALTTTGCTKSKSPAASQPTAAAPLTHAWQEAKQVREIMLFLHSHGASTSRAVRIFKTGNREGAVGTLIRDFVKAELRSEAP